MNKVIIMGRLGADPEMRYTPNQMAVATLNVATTEVRMKEGQRQELTEWHRVVVWNRQAENCAKYLSKGRQVLVEGRLQTRSWEDKNGQKRYTTEIVANNVQFVGGAQQGASSPSYDSPERQQDAPTRFPQAETHQQESASPSYGSGSSDSAVDYSDIPF